MAFEVKINIEVIDRVGTNACHPCEVCLRPLLLAKKSGQSNPDHGHFSFVLDFSTTKDFSACFCWIISDSALL